ncbi:predicted protein [Naegleria gruberi]|uniref:Predicted protein n=1 Tax=Naegleria gruberi TaxID=5762 RepID=D2V090_NAEGR|nr:uncharacterized protein NAEGRDRAFT_29976 [Naegleria gruberi]EFC49676.1 predicted protein [Naegleria gruberi]|eukprot:XP_002682420.1 predicted protein [Naegleria gruberi strain NEG-M]
MNRNILHHACQWGNIETVKYGISRGVPVNVKDSLGNTPLHYCCGEGYFNIVALLLYHPKIKVDVKNKEGHTPRRRAYFHGHDDVLILLDKFMGNIAVRVFKISIFGKLI